MVINIISLCYSNFRVYTDVVGIQEDKISSDSLNIGLYRQHKQYNKNLQFNEDYIGGLTINCCMMLTKSTNFESDEYESQNPRRNLHHRENFTKRFSTLIYDQTIVFTKLQFLIVFHNVLRTFVLISTSSGYEKLKSLPISKKSNSSGEK